MKKKVSPGQKIICLNRKASFNYFFKELLEAGICLKGSEVKSLRDGKGSIADSYAIDKDGEIFLINSHISMLAKLLFTASREQPSTSSRLSSPLTTSSATSSSMFCVPWSQYVHPSCSTFSSRSKLCSKISWCSSRCKT